MSVSVRSGQRLTELSRAYYTCQNDIKTFRICIVIDLYSMAKSCKRHYILAHIELFVEKSIFVAVSVHQQWKHIGEILSIGV